MQPQLCLMDAKFTLGWRAKPAVEFVGPSVVRAGERTPVTALGVANASAAMTAGVVKSANLAVRAAHKYDAIGASIPRHPIAGFGDLAGVPGIQPMPSPNEIEIGAENIGGEIERAGKRAARSVARLQHRDPRCIVVICWRGRVGHPLISSPVRLSRWCLTLRV